MPICFLMRVRNGIDPDGMGRGEKLGKVEGGETIIRVYFMKNSNFNKRKNLYLG